LDGTNYPNEWNISNYTFSNVTGSHTLQANFKNKFTIYIRTDRLYGVGSMNPPTNFQVNYGSNVTVNGIPAGGPCYVGQIDIDGITIASGMSYGADIESYTFTNVHADHEVRFYFYCDQ
jgi:hypothetical protein